MEKNSPQRTPEAPLSPMTATTDRVASTEQNVNSKSDGLKNNSKQRHSKTTAGMEERLSEELAKQTANRHKFNSVIVNADQRAGSE